MIDHPANGSGGPPGPDRDGWRGDEHTTLIPAERLSTLRDAASLAAGDDALRQAELLEAVDRFVKPLEILQDLPRDATDTLGGSGQALDRLVTALAMVGGLSAAMEKLPSEADAVRLRRRFREPETEVQPSGIVDGEQIGVIGLAAAYSSVARPEAADAIERGLAVALAGLMPLDLLWTLAADVLDGDARSTRLYASVLDRMSDFSKPIGPPDPWVPPLLDLLKVVPFDRREWLERVGCLIHSFDEVRRLGPIVDPYVINSITPSSECPGQPITITGSGFGSQTHTVRFPTLGGSADGQVTSWSDGLIEVVVPADATCGDLVLVIPVGQATTCGNQAVDVVKPGSGTPYFDGGITHIDRFAGNAVRVDPGSTLEFTWKVCPSTAGVRLKVTVRETGAVLTDRPGLPTDGRSSVVVPAFTSRRTLDCVLEATGPCPPSPARQTLVIDVLPKPNVKIEGMEITQGIQRFWRQGIVPNSVSTVAGKETIVRVYVSADRGGFNNDEVPGIYGVLSVGGSDLRPINGITPTNPSGALASHTARKITAINRDNVNHTLNFRIPAALCWGTKFLFCYLIVPGPGGTVDQTVGFALTWTWEAETALKVRWVRITDNHDPANITPTTPTDAQALQTTRRALDLLPYPADLAPASTPAHTTTRDFAVDAEGAAMRMDIENLRTAAEGLGGMGAVPFDAEERWIGLTVPWFRGWGNPKTCVAPIYPAGSTDRERLRAGHELGHTLGRCHLHDSACFMGAGLTAEPTLDDTAFDPFWNRTIAATGHDFMSYTTPDENWITTLNWNALRSVL